MSCAIFGTLYTKKSCTIYLKFKFNWETYIFTYFYLLNLATRGRKDQERRTTAPCSRTVGVVSKALGWESGDGRPAPMQVQEPLLCELQVNSYLGVFSPSIQRPMVRMDRILSSEVLPSLTSFDFYSYIH